VARATSAAPTYFNPITINDHKFLDGGFGTNNPAEEIYREVCQMNGNDRRSVGLLVSIGTGQFKHSKFATGPLRHIALLSAVKHIVTDGENVHQRMENDNLPNNKEGQRRYYRFNVPYERQSRSAAAGTETTWPVKARHLGEMAIDEWKAESRLFQRRCNTTLRDIKAATEAYLASREVQADLEEVARILVETRRERCQEDYWELVSTGTQYRCVYTQCHSLKSQKMRVRERNLRSHLRKAHSLTGAEIDKYVDLGRCPA
jgi:hypothetical protein